MAILAGAAAGLGLKALLAKMAVKGAAGAATKGAAGGEDDLLGGGMGSKAGTVLGLIQKGAGYLGRKRADAMLPAMEDPMTKRMRETTTRRRRALETGTASSAERAAEQQTLTSMGKRMAKSGGRMNIGLLNQMMAQNATQRAAGTGQEISQLLGLESNITSEMAQRKSDLSTLRSTRKSAQAETSIASGRENLAAGLGINYGKKKKKKDDESSAQA